jgi:hypothetical protein
LIAAAIPGRQIRAQALDRRMRLVKNAERDRLRIRGIERKLPGEQLIQHHAEGKHVGARLQVVAAHLLRRHEGRRTEVGDGRLVQVAKDRAAEVRDADLARRHAQDVGRLDVAVDHPAARGIAKCDAALARDLEDFVERQALVRRGVGLQVAATDVLHHHIVVLAVGKGIETVIR